VLYATVLVGRHAVPHEVNAAGACGRPYRDNRGLRSIYCLAQKWVLSARPSSFALRQIPAAVASVFYRLGAHYDTAAVIDSIGIETKRQFFAMILSNGLAVCLAFAIAAGYVRSKLSKDNIVNSFALFGILGGWFYFPSVVIAPNVGRMGLVRQRDRAFFAGNDSDFRPDNVRGLTFV
jgi:hypothetical protein